jgi:hypothetical protein
VNLQINNVIGRFYALEENDQDIFTGIAYPFTTAFIIKTKT